MDIIDNDTDDYNIGETGSRRAILLFLKRHGAVRADAMAKSLNLTTMAVRQHLYRLAEKGLVEERTDRIARGRPPKLWTLTQGGHDRFPDRHRDLALQIVESVHESFGPDGMDRLLAVRTQKQKDAYRARIPQGSPEDRVKALAAIRSEEGYMAQAMADEMHPGVYYLVENHCPICTLARTCSGLCRQELELFRAVLGPDMHIERTEHILKGARRCTYKISTGINPT